MGGQQFSNFIADSVGFHDQGSRDTCDRALRLHVLGI